MSPTNLILFTDLDGTLFDNHTYSWQAAAPALAKLRERQVPLFLCTRKTAAETSELHLDRKSLCVKPVAISGP